LFLDSSVLLAAAGSTRGASRFVVNEAGNRGWELVSADYCADETCCNLSKAGGRAAIAWNQRILPRLRLMRTHVALDRPLVFPKSKDRPVVITALAARADWLLTLDEKDFPKKLGRAIYGVRIALPGEFLQVQRGLGAL
jgi:predicted nucleic acid-binding protein